MLPSLDPTSPRLQQQNEVNLRIKSSKAFPAREVGALEEIITKVKKFREISELKAKRLKESQMKLEQGLGVESLDAMQLYNDNRATLLLNTSQ